MLIRVLGSAAGGGFPQWNCNCRNCRGAREGSLRALPRTQSSIAISSDGRQWLLCNASPDLHRQIESNPPLCPTGGVRDSPIRGVALVDAQIDHAAGLLLLRERSTPLEIWATEEVRGDLSEGFPLLTILGHYCGVRFHALRLDAPTSLDALPGVSLSVLAVAGKPGPYSPHRARPRPGDNVAFAFRDTHSGRQLLYAPGLGDVDDRLRAAMAASACVLVDGTFWDDDEMIRARVSQKRARDIGHLPLAGPAGLLERLALLPSTTRRILVHVNNTNPILDEDSAERAAVAAAGVEVAYDGMEIEL